MPRRHKQAEAAFALALTISLLACNLPFGGILLYPVKLLATWFHELSHGIMMLLTGNGFDRMLLYADTSGLAFADQKAGPVASAFIIAAGYGGTPLLGAGLLVATPTRAAARRSLAILATVILATTWLLVANTFGLIALTAIGAGIALLGLILPARLRLLALQLVAAQACVNALLDIRVLFSSAMVINGVPSGDSDATAMARIVFATDAAWAQTFWAVAWLLWSLAILFLALRWVAQQQRTAESMRLAAHSPSAADTHDTEPPHA